MTDKPMTDKDLRAVRNLQDSLIDGIMAATDEEVLADLAEDGLDPEKEAALMKADLALAAGRARMSIAKASVERDRARSATFSRPQAAANDVADVKRLTRAARNGTEQSEADIRSEAEDLAEIREFQSGRPEG